MGVSKLIGSWESLTFKRAVYTFKEGGRGYYSFLGAKKEFDYTDNGDSVKIHFVGDYAPNSFAYTVEGDKLLINDSFGTINTYIYIE